MGHFFRAILGNSLFLLLIVGPPLLAILYLPYEYGMPVILIWVGGLCLIWLMSVVRAIMRKREPGGDGE